MGGLGHNGDWPDGEHMIESIWRWLWFGKMRTNKACVCVDEARAGQANRMAGRRATERASRLPEIPSDACAGNCEMMRGQSRRFERRQKITGAIPVRDYRPGGADSA